MPNKPKNLTIYFASHHDPDLYYPLKIDYFLSLKETLELLSLKNQRPNKLKRIPEVLYNKYGQVIPLNYQVPRTDLIFYIDPAPIPPNKWEDILITPNFSSTVKPSPAIKSNSNKTPDLLPQSQETTDTSACWLSDSDPE